MATKTIDEMAVIDELTTKYRSLYLYRGDGSYWSGTIVMDDARPATEITYTDNRQAHVVLDGRSLQVHAWGDSRAEVLSRLVYTIANAETLLARAEPKAAVVAS